MNDGRPKTRETPEQAPRRQGAGVVWTLALVAAVAPVLYVLSVAPLHYATVRAAPPGVGLDPFEPPPAGVIAYGKPYDWLEANTPLGALLNRYDVWWFNIISGWRTQPPHP